MITQVLYTISLIVAVLVTWNVQDWRLGGQIATLKTQHAQAYANAVTAQQSAENAITHKYQGALNDARDRETALRAAAAAARAQSDGLRKQTHTAARRLAAPDVAPGAVIEYATASSELLADCSRRYQELGELADGHAADVRTLLAAWPVMPEDTP